ncbi:cytochrome c family protein [Phenylobacterium sp. LjRoot219]|uniref:c-type cytochrome n=1 Tax=Phenylobacterium sp. LjRoot219 TaxID=3342283 RepID=UPI003ECD8588
MSDLTFNKVAGAVLATGLAIFGLRELSSGIFGHEKVEKPGFAVEVAAETGGDAAAAEVPPDWGTVLPTADVAAGQAVFAKCQSCHNITNGGANGTGPNLWGVVGHKPGSHAGFAYSPAMEAFAAKQPIWDYEHVYEFVKNPQKYMPGTKMTFVGLKKQEDRINLIAYLHAQGSTLPIPAPNPAAATAPAAEGAPTATGNAEAGNTTAVAGGPAGQGAAAPAGGAPAEQKAPAAQH